MCTLYGPHNTEVPGIFSARKSSHFAFMCQWAAFIGFNGALSPTLCPGFNVASLGPRPDGWYANFRYLCNTIQRHHNVTPVISWHSVYDFSSFLKMISAKIRTHCTFKIYNHSFTMNKSEVFSHQSVVCICSESTAIMYLLNKTQFVLKWGF